MWWRSSIGTRVSTSALPEVLCKHCIMHEAAFAQVLHLRHFGDRVRRLRDHEPGLPLMSLTDRRIHLAGVLLCAICLAYFYRLDRVLFSSAHFSPIFRFLLTAYDSRTAWLALAICLLAALWNRPAPILRLVEVFGKHPYAV